MAPNTEDTQSYDLKKQSKANKSIFKKEKPAASEIKKDLKNQSQSSQNRPIIDFDDLLPYIGEFGRYQKLLFLMMIPFAFYVAFVYFSQIFMTLVPDEHWCAVPELDNFTMEQR